MSTVIKVDNLSKKYLIGHQNREKYQTLREALAQNIRVAGRRLLHPLRASSGQPLVGAGSVEAFWALKDISFEVKQGERIGIIGRNGAGKSTLLKILSRITEPTAGRISLKGRLASLLEVGTGFHPELTGRENIFLNGSVHGMCKAEIKKRFDEIVAFAEVEKFLDTPVKRYSSGMYVRLAFAVAAHLQPEILIVDEVLAVGDSQFQKKCLGKMEEAGQEGRTVLFVSHNMAAVKRLCDKAILLSDGQFTSSGDTSTVIGEYLNGNVEPERNGRPGSYDFTDRVNGYGDHAIVISGLNILDAEKNITSNTLMGSPAYFQIDVDGLSNYEGASIGIVFKSNDGRRLAGISTAMVTDGIRSPRKQKEKAMLRIPRLPFTPGRVILDISVARFGSRIDYIENAANFHVVEDDVYGSGFKVDSFFGDFYLEGGWEIF